MKTRLSLVVALVLLAGFIFLRRPATGHSQPANVAPAQIRSPIRPLAVRRPAFRSAREIIGEHLAALKAALVEPGGDIKPALAALEAWLQSQPEGTGDLVEIILTDADLPSHFLVLSETIFASADFPQCAAALKTAALRLAGQPGGPEPRLQALAALGHLSSVDAESFSLARDLATGVGDLRVRYGAIGTMAMWLNEPGEWRGKITEVLSGLARQMPERELQSDALRILIAHHPGLPDEMRALINHFLEGRPSVEDRLMVGMTVGAFAEADEGAINFALTHLEEAFRQEKKLAQQRYILSQIVRFGRTNVAELIAQLPADHQLLAQDVQDYQEILAQGTADSLEIERQKLERDHRRGTPLPADEDPAH